MKKLKRVLDIERVDWLLNNGKDVMLAYPDSHNSEPQQRLLEQRLKTSLVKDEYVLEYIEDKTYAFTNIGRVFGGYKKAEIALTSTDSDIFVQIKNKRYKFSELYDDFEYSHFAERLLELGTKITKVNA